MNGITQQEIDDYGTEFVDVMRRVATETAAPLQAEVANLRGQLGQVQQETGHAFLERMNRELEALVPRWSELNQHPEFVAWSQLPDQFSGRLHRAMMQEAWNAGDARRVAAFFQAFLAERGQRPNAGRQAAGNSPHLPQGAPARRDDVNLYTRQQVAKFHDDVRRGYWRNREPERAALDADILRAGAEGRIVDAVDARAGLTPHTK